MFQSIPPLASAWNPYQGLSTPYHSLGGNFAGYGGYTAGVGQTPNFAGPQGLPFGSAGSIGHFGQPGASQIPGQSFQNFGSSAQSGWNPLGPPRLPFLATLNLPDLTKLTNDPIRYNPAWPPVPTKLPSDIPKFEGKSGEDPGDHVTTFHLWCSSNSLIEDSIRLRLFQRTLTGNAAKWYIELPGGSFTSFADLANIFLNHFQLPVRYDAGTELLATFRQDKATHISDHIQEWRRRKRLIKAEIPPEYRLEWFLKSLQPEISKDVSMSGVYSEEQAIFRAQQLELIYSQSGILQKYLPDAPGSKVDLAKPKPGPHADGIVGSVDSTTVNLLNQLQQLSLQTAPNNQVTMSNPHASQNSSINAVQSDNPKGNQNSNGKKKGRGKKKNSGWEARCK